MKNISKYTQVLTVSHLPQVAAIADNHLHITKGVDDMVTIQASLLSEQERIVEIAKMLSGNNLSETAFAHARELLGVEG